uniref:Glutathione hydrolase proenzyme n=1 Tax=uncultured Gemmatimonadetes bacterium Rifle_16ft_4_minimus_7 TaxID=1665098 RepID=A0A0H4TUW7_9BACT|nr:ggt, gamma-glutamyltranspeptidase precursor, gamma-glutamyltranspeptidase [uncultured Gemmatimonadetes bacterium Rifle_16ft_4_minimus_7]
MTRVPSPAPLWLLGTLLVGACAPAPSAPPEPVATRPPTNMPEAWPLFARLKADTASSGMVVSGSPLASQVGVEILKQGGSAVDAAVAVGFALAVVHPEAGNLGGGGFMVMRFADGRTNALDYRETAPGQASRDMYLDAQGKLTDQSLTGHLAAGVPGSVAGLAEAHRRHGKLTWTQVVAPAIRLARDGFVVDEFRSRSIGGSADRLRRFPASRAQFLPGGNPPRPGTTLQQPDLAVTLQAIADSGPRAFYQGRTADLIVTEMEQGGGIITKADLAAYRPVWRDPIVIKYRGHTIYSMPPSSSGGVTMAEALNILEGYDPLPEFGSVAYVHLLAEALRRAFVDRNQYLGDPAFVSMPLDRLLSKKYAAELRAQIQPDRATPTPAFVSSAREGENTTHYSVVDAAGNAASVTTTINSSYGSAVTVTGAGFLLNNEMDDFAAAPGKPNQYGLVQGEANAIQPGKRMLSAMTPSIVVDPSGRLKMVLGSPGGPTIITSVTQVILNVLDHHMALSDAVAVTRIHHQALPDVINYERGGLLPVVVAALKAMGHQADERSGFSGDIAAIERRGNAWIGVPDPRRGGGAAGY